MEEVEGGDEGRAHDSARWREDSLARFADAVAQYRETGEDAAADGADVNVVVGPGVAGVLQSSLRALDRRKSMTCALSMVPCLTSLYVRANVAHDAGSGGPRCLIMKKRREYDTSFDSWSGQTMYIARAA